VNTPSYPPAGPTFQVRFGPEKPARIDEPWANNLRLANAGVLEVGAGFVRVSDGRNLEPEARRTFAMADIANVGFDASGNVVALRTRSGDRTVYLWMASAGDAQTLVQLLPRDTTPEFMELLRQREQYRANRDAIAPRVRVTPALIAINVVIFAIMVLAGAGLMELDARVHLQFGSNYGPLTWNGEPWRLLASAFIHFGVIHIAMNMFALHNGGALTEELYGNARFAVIYLLAALAGSVVSGWWDPSRNSAGASGAVFGVYGALLAYIARYPHAIPADLLKSVRSGAILLCVYSLAAGAVVKFIDNAAHVGGLLGGAVSGYLLARPFDPAARAVAKPWQVAGVAAGTLAALALLSRRLWW
jgi:rhomboid protease GluP